MSEALYLADPDDLLSFALRLPSVEAWRVLRERVQSAGVQVEDRPDPAAGSIALVRDPDGNGAVLLADKK